MTKSIVLCADDYGQAQPISDGILHLVANQRLTAVSCLVNALDWPSQASLLSPYHRDIDIGLHFNLTQGRPLSTEYLTYYGLEFQPLSVLLLKSICRRLQKSVLAAECHAQLDAFESAMGFLPDYLDGHQHVHQFPVIREAVCEVYQDRLRTVGSYVRYSKDLSPAKHIAMAAKKRFIRLMGGRLFEQLLAVHKIPYNQSFAGIYSFSSSKCYREMFLTFLKSIQANGIIMCHPGLEQGKSVPDAIAGARMDEYHYLIGEHFLMDCQKNGVVLGRFDREL